MRIAGQPISPVWLTSCFGGLLWFRVLLKRKARGECRLSADETQNMHTHKTRVCSHFGPSMKKIPHSRNVWCFVCRYGDRIRGMVWDCVLVWNPLLGRYIIFWVTKYGLLQSNSDRRNKKYKHIAKGNPPKLRVSFFCGAYKKNGLL